MQKLIVFILVLFLICGCAGTEKKHTVKVDVVVTQPKSEVQQIQEDVNKLIKTNKIPVKTIEPLEQDKYIEYVVGTWKHDRDCLWNIAKRFYNNGMFWHMIYDVNKTKIKNPNLIYPGQKLKIYL